MLMSGRDFMDDKDVFNMLMEIRDNVTTIKVTQEAFTASHGFISLHLFS